LAIKTKARATLLLGRDTIVGDEGMHDWPQADTLTQLNMSTPKRFVSSCGDISPDFTRPRSAAWETRQTFIDRGFTRIEHWGEEDCLPLHPRLLARPH
jgi:hypothetical protein